MWIVQYTDPATGRVRQVVVPGASANVARSAVASALGVNIDAVTAGAFDSEIHRDVPTFQEVFQPSGGGGTGGTDGGTGGTGGTGTQSGRGGGALGGEEAGGRQGFFQSFLRGLENRGLNAGIGSGVAGSILQRQFDPAFAVALGQTAFNPGLEGLSPEDTFRAFVESGNITPGGLGQQAESLFRRAVERSAGVRSGADGGFNFGNLSGLSAELLNPSGVGEAQNLGDLARTAARQRFGSFSQFLPSSQELANQFFAQQRQNASPFATFLQNQLGFGRGI